MEPFKYYFEFNGNRELPEEEQGHALMFPLSAKEKSAITDHLISASVRSGNKKVEINFAEKSLEINKRNISGIFNVINPLTDEKIDQIRIEDVYKTAGLGELYEELSNALGDINTLKTGIKKK